MDHDKTELEATAKRFNLGAGLLTNLLKSEPQAKENFLNTIQMSQLESSEQKVGNMLYSIATKLPITLERFREPLAQWVASGRIDNPNHLDFTIEYIKNWENKGGADIGQVENECAVGVKLTNE